MERLRQIRNLSRTTSLKALIDRPGITAGLGDQRWDAYVAQLHRTTRGLAAPPSLMSMKSAAPECRKTAPTSIATPPEPVITLLPARPAAYLTPIAAAILQRPTGSTPRVSAAATTAAVQPRLSKVLSQ